MALLTALEPSVDGTWMAAYGYCTPLATTTHSYDPPPGNVPTSDVASSNTVNAPPAAPTAGANAGAPSKAAFECVGGGELYVAALLWGVMVITGVGGPDFERGRFNSSEQVCVMLLVLLGSILWTYVLATFCEVVANARPESAEFRRTMDALNRMMRTHALPKRLRRRLREYFHQARHLTVARATEHVLHTMSPLLQEEVTLRTNCHWLDYVWFLRGVESACAVQIAMAVSPLVFVPTERPPPQCLYVIHRGAVLYEGRLLTRHKCWGEDVILSSDRYRSPGHARAMTYLEAYSITHDGLMTIVLAFPVASYRVRRAAFLLALRRDIKMRAAAARLALTSDTGHTLERRPSLTDPIPEAANAAAPHMVDASSGATSAPLLLGRPPHCTTASPSTPSPSALAASGPFASCVGAASCVGVEVEVVEEASDGPASGEGASGVSASGPNACDAGACASTSASSITTAAASSSTAPPRSDHVAAPQVKSSRAPAADDHTQAIRNALLADLAADARAHFRNHDAVCAWLDAAAMRLGARTTLPLS